MRFSFKNKQFFVLLISICFLPEAMAFDDKETHPKLTTEAYDNSDIEALLSGNLRFSLKTKKFNVDNNQLSVIELLTKGSEEEDTPMCRASNHFHSPFKSEEDWTDAQVNSLAIDVFCSFDDFNDPYSNVIWATGKKSRDQTPFTPAVNNDPNSKTNGRNWDVARNFFYTALTATNDISYESNMIETFLTLGHIMHLLQDMAAPAHTRNDFSFFRSKTYV